MCDQGVSELVCAQGRIEIICTQARIEAVCTQGRRELLYSGKDRVVRVYARIELSVFMQGLSCPCLCKD